MKITHDPHQMIVTPAQLENFCATARAAGYLTFDTEFISESSYRPWLCLLQAATTDCVVVIDPLAVTDLTVFWELLADPAVLKIAHASEQDLLLVRQYGDLIPQNMMDTQIAAGLVGLGYPLGYAKLVEEFCGHNLPKSHTYSNWGRRPLTTQQLQYAADDVRFIADMWVKLRKLVEEQGRMDWLKEACTELIHDSTRVSTPDELFRRVRGWGYLNADQLAILRELAVWRNDTAAALDKPLRVIVKDEALVELARKQSHKLPVIQSTLLLPRQYADAWGVEIQTAITHGMNRPDKPTPAKVTHDIPGAKELGDSLWLGFQSHCIGNALAPGLITNHAEIETFARRFLRNQSCDDLSLFTGWRRAAAGAWLVEFASGRVNLEMRIEGTALRVKK